MDELIKRQDAIDILNKLDVSDGVGISSVACDLQEEAIRSIENLPSVQSERKTGKWIGTTTAECSECRSLYPAFMKFANYCPNCGAYMRGEQE